MSNDTNLDREKFKAVMSNMEQLEQMQKNDFDNFQLAHDMLYLKGELQLDPPLTSGELYTLASKTLWASRNTNCSSSLRYWRIFHTGRLRLRTK